LHCTDNGVPWRLILSDRRANSKSACSAPPTAEALHGLYDAWIDCAEEAYARMAHGEPFGVALADALKAASEWREESAASAKRIADARP
jgi:hypothetical protein